MKHLRKNREIRLVSLAAPLVLLLVLGATAQMPSNTKYLVTDFDQTPFKLRGFGPLGALTTVVPLLGSGEPCSLAMAPTNDHVVIWEGDGVEGYNLTTGIQTVTTLASDGSSISWGCVDEDAGMVWVTDTGKIYRARTTAGLHTTLLRNDPSRVYNAVCWNGHTGGYVACDFNGSVVFLDREGAVNRLVTGLGMLSGCDWSPFSGDVFVSRFGDGLIPGVLRITQSGVVTSIGPTGILTDTTNAVKVFEQPLERLALVEAGGSSPQFLMTMLPNSGMVTVLSLDVGTPSDVDVVRQRSIWGLGAWVRGGTGIISLNFGPDCQDDHYQVALSLGYRPGIPLGVDGVLHLVPDALFAVSLSGVPVLFQNFVGTLDSNGVANPRPQVALPLNACLQGLRIYAGAVAYDAGGIQAISNCWGVTLQ